MLARRGILPILATAVAVSLAAPSASANDAPPCSAIAGPGTDSSLEQDGADVVVSFRTVGIDSTWLNQIWTWTLVRRSSEARPVTVVEDVTLDASVATETGTQIGCSVSCADIYRSCWGPPKPASCLDCDDDGAAECGRLCAVVPVHRFEMRDPLVPPGHTVYELTAEGYTAGPWSGTHTIDVAAVGEGGAAGDGGAGVTGAAGAPAEGGSGGAASTLDPEMEPDEPSGCDMKCGVGAPGPRAITTMALLSIGALAASIARRRASRTRAPC